MSVKILAGIGILAIVGLVFANQLDQRFLSEQQNQINPADSAGRESSPQQPLTQNENPAPPPTANKCGVSLSKVYTDNKLGFAVSYPSIWFPSRLEYANVFDIKNYDDSKTAPAREKFGQVTIGPHEVALSSEDALKRLEEIAGPHRNQKDFALKRFTIQGRPALKFSYRYKPLEAGFAQKSDDIALPKFDKDIFASYLAVVDGVNIITVTGTAWEDASAQTFCEIEGILSSLSFTSSSKPSPSTGSAPLGGVCGTVVYRPGASGYAQSYLSVDLKLLDKAGKEVSSTKSDSNGEYQFSNIPIGEYTVEESQYGTRAGVSVVEGVCVKRDVVIAAP